ncbi:hypothetical protein KUCAC02_006842, partial [Chaenocephalus aceratus]
VLVVLLRLHTNQTPRKRQHRDVSEALDLDCNPGGHLPSPARGTLQQAQSSQSQGRGTPPQPSQGDTSGSLHSGCGCVCNGCHAKLLVLATPCPSHHRGVDEEAHAAALPFFILPAPPSNDKRPEIRIVCARLTSAINIASVQSKQRLRTLLQSSQAE